MFMYMYVHCVCACHWSHEHVVLKSALDRTFRLYRYIMYICSELSAGYYTTMYIFSNKLNIIQSQMVMKSNAMPTLVPQVSLAPPSVNT